MPIRVPSSAGILVPWLVHLNSVVILSPRPLSGLGETWDEDEVCSALILICVSYPGSLADVLHCHSVRLITHFLSVYWSLPSFLIKSVPLKP